MNKNLSLTRILLVQGVSLIILLFTIIPAYAVENPLDKPNNKVGIHILFTSELKDAAKLINSNNGDWGYVTIPIQAGDRDLDKWQGFFDEAKKLHVIPIIRLATEGDYFNTKVWRKPTANDLLDFANFLNSLYWSTKNRYIIVFNEVNRGDEWGGTPNPAEYTDLLSYAAFVFKSKNQDFFIISAGLDNAATTGGNSINQYDFLRQMYAVNSSIFNQIDGISSHSYPNPSFSQPPSVQTGKSISSFRFERELIRSFSGKELPVFITETGWSREFVNENNASSYLKDAFISTWSDPGVVAVTPFLLKANAGPFINFSFFASDGSPNQEYKSLESLSKIKGEPVLSPDNLETSTQSAKRKVLGVEVKNFSEQDQDTLTMFSVPSPLKSFLRWLLKI